MKNSWIFYVFVFLFFLNPSQVLAQADKGVGPDPKGSSKEDVARLEERVQELEALVRQLQRQVESLPGARDLEPNRSPSRASESTSKAAPAVTNSISTSSRRKEEDPNTFRAYWKDGLRLESQDGKFRLNAGGRINNDWEFISADQAVEDRVGPLRDGTEFRRSRFYVSGVVHETVEFKAEYDFAGDGPTRFNDVYVGLTDLPLVGNVRVGHFKEPFSLDFMTSGRHLTFLERSLLDTFTPARNTGVMLHDALADGRVTWAGGVFKNADAFGDGREDGGFNYTGRLTGLPWYREDGARLLHLGVAYSHRNPSGNRVRFSQRPEAHLAPRFADTGNIPAESVELLGIEGAWVEGPFSVQSEMVHSFVNTPGGGDPRFNSFYVQGSYFLTGEHRNYRKSAAAFDRLTPHSSYSGREGGGGAWELAARYSYLDLRDKGFDGGNLEDFSFAINWYLNPVTRVMWNYIYSDLERVGQTNIVEARFQIEF